MNELTVNVNLYGKEVGVLSWNDNRGLAEFQYYPKFLRGGLDVAPITMPLKNTSPDFVHIFPANRNECFKGLPGMIADSLPDKYGNEIINAWFAAHGIADTQVTPLDRLCYIGNRAMGALEFEPSRNIRELGESTVLRMDSLVSLADKVYRDREAFRENIRQEDKAILDILKVGTSAGGAKPKALIALNEKTNEVRSGQVKAPEGFTYWLLKFDGTTFVENGEKIDASKGISNIEYAYYKMACSCNIRMTECRLLEEQDSFHFMTKRFDRLDNGEKIHSQTLAAIAHYDRDSLHSYEEGFRVIRKLGLGYNEMEQFFRRMVFNVVSRNHDDHTKNHSFLMDREGRWNLAPAYDLCYTYSPHGKWTSVHQMSVNGKRDDFTWEDLAETGRRMDIKNPDIIIGNIVEVVSRWNHYAKDCGVYENHANLIAENHRLLSPPERLRIKKPLLDCKEQKSMSQERKRISDISIYTNQSGTKFFVRCKVDSRQQMANEIDRKEYMEYMNGRLSKMDIALKNYQEELKNNEQSIKGLKI